MRKILINLTGDLLVLLGAATPIAGSAASCQYHLPLQPWQVFVVWTSGAIFILTGMHFHHLAATLAKRGFEAVIPQPATK